MPTAAKGFIHSHGNWDADSDNQFSDWKEGTEAKHYDNDLMAEFPSLDFYLSTPDGSLLRTKANSNMYEGKVIAEGLPRDEVHYKKPRVHVTPQTNKDFDENDVIDILDNRLNDFHTPKNIPSLPTNNIDYKTPIIDAGRANDRINKNLKY